MDERQGNLFDEVCERSQGLLPAMNAASIRLIGVSLACSLRFRVIYHSVVSSVSSQYISTYVSHSLIHPILLSLQGWHRAGLCLL
jgi:hypothetical protein